jgi:hypothetical protein
MIKNVLIVLLSLAWFGQASAAEMGGTKPTTQDLDKLNRNLDRLLNDSKVGDREISIKPRMGAEPKACVILPDGTVCCGSQQACGGQSK